MGEFEGCKCVGTQINSQYRALFLPQYRINMETGDLSFKQIEWVNAYEMNFKKLQTLKSLF